MAIQQVQSVDGPDGDVVHVFGEPGDIEWVTGHSDGVEDILISGYSVKNVADAQHDGFPAKRFVLTADNTEVGRLVLRTNVLTEYTFEFDVLFVDSHAADRFIDEVQNPPATPKVVQSTQDLSYMGDLDEEIAIMCAKHGVSITVIDPHGPGGGWPVVKVVGLAENVRSVLTADEYGWSYSPVEADTMIEAVTS